MTRIDEIAARAAAATRGPWWYQEEEGHWFGCGDRTVSDCGVIASAEYNWENGEPTLEIEPSDADFVANARDDIPFLLAEIASLTARAEKAERERDAAVEDMKVVCMAGEPCAVCVNCENRGDQFPCGYGEWCGGEHWQYRGPQEAGKGE